MPALWHHGENPLPGSLCIARHPRRVLVAEGPGCKVGVGGGERFLAKLSWSLKFQQMLFSITQLFASKQMFDIT